MAGKEKDGVMTKKKLRSLIIKYQNRTGADKYTARAAILKTLSDGN